MLSGLLTESVDGVEQQASLIFRLFFRLLLLLILFFFCPFYTLLTPVTWTTSWSAGVAIRSSFFYNCFETICGVTIDKVIFHVGRSMVWSAKRKYTKRTIWAVTERRRGKRSPVDCALWIEIRRRRPREAGTMHMRAQEYSSGEPFYQTEHPAFLLQIVTRDRRVRGDKPTEGHKE